MAKAKILLVEDEEVLAEMVKFRLEAADYDVTVANDGESAIENLKEFVPDLLILDMRLPGINGTEVCDWIKEQERLKQLPVIIFTASAGEEQKWRSVLKADGFVTKPFEPKQLLDEVGKVLKSG